MRGWRGLGLFWAVVAAILVAGVVILAVLGPKPVSAVPAAPVTYHGNNTAWPGPKVIRAVMAIHAPDPALLEAAADFPGRKLPRIDPAGRRPAELYAAAAADRPGIRVAVVLAGIGLDHADSLAAIHALPPAVDLAVSAYAADVQGVLQAARAGGHEFLASLPMEPAGYPAADAGPHALLTTATPAENARNLQWALSRIEGYVGVTGASDGQRGERYAASPSAMATVGAELGRRGVFYLDPLPDGSPPAGVEARAVDVTIDGPDGIDDGLAALERQARGAGTAIGLVARPSPVAVAHLVAWAAGLAGRGIALVPASALIVHALIGPAQMGRGGTP